MFGRTVQQSEGSQFQEGLQQDVYPLAFSELITYIVDTKSSKEGPSLLRLADMVQLYKQRLEQIGGIEKPDVNSTRLKEKLLAEISELEAHKQVRDVILTFDEDIGLALSQASDYSDAIILAKATKILRRHMLDHMSKFDGTFHDGCIEERVNSIQSGSVCGHDWTWCGHQISTEIWCFKDRTSNCTAAAVQLLCKVQRRSSNS